MATFGPIISQQNFNLNPLKFLMGSILNTPYYTANIAYWYQQAFVFESFSLMFLAYRLAMALKVFRSVDIILKSIETVIYFAITF